MRNSQGMENYSVDYRLNQHVKKLYFSIFSSLPFRCHLPPNPELRALPPCLIWCSKIHPPQVNFPVPDPVNLIEALLLIIFFFLKSKFSHTLARSIASTVTSGMVSLSGGLRSFFRLNATMFRLFRDALARYARQLAGLQVTSFPTECPLTCYFSSSYVRWTRYPHLSSASHVWTWIYRKNLDVICNFQHLSHH